MAAKNLNRLPYDRKVLTRFFAKIRVSTEHFYNGAPCWDWTANRNNHGYGMFSYQSRKRLAHLIGYQMFVEIVPKGLECDHLCRRPICCNPAHIEPVTHRENVTVRADSSSGINARKVVCKRGHLLPTKRNPDGSRQCSQCAEIRRREKGQMPMKIATHCKRGHLLPPHQKGVGRKCARCRTELARAKGALPRGCRTHCRRGHAFLPDNVIMLNGFRNCAKCHREARKRIYEKLRRDPAKVEKMRAANRRCEAKIMALADEDPRKVAYRAKNATYQRHRRARLAALKKLAQNDS